MTIDHTKVRLGRVKSPPEKLNKALKLAQFLDLSALPVAPDRLDWSVDGPPDWGVMLNDDIGDCAVAAPAHMVQIATLVASQAMVTISDKDILTAYRNISGYDPRNPASDIGCNMIDVLDYWRDVGIGGHRIKGYVAIQPDHHAMARVALWLFGALYVGYSLPTTAQNQEIWDVVPGLVPGTWGGHAVVRVSQSRDMRQVITWGYRQKATEAFDDRCCDELHAVIMPEWTPNERTVAGFDAVALQQALSVISA